MHSIMLVIQFNLFIINLLTKFNFNKYYACIIFTKFGLHHSYINDG